MQHSGRERAALRDLLRAVWGDELVPEPPRAQAPRLAGRAAVAFGMLFIVMAVAPLGANATQGSPEHKVTLCHATDSYTNPYVRISVDVASVIKNHGHGDHDGPVFYPSIPKHTKWGDIIPPFDFGAAGSYSGKNWTAGGQAIFDDGCDMPPPPTTTPTTDHVTTTTIEVGPSTSVTSAPATTTTQVTPTTEPASTTTSAGGTTTTVANATSTSQPSTQTTQATASSTTVVALGTATTVVQTASTTTEPSATGSTASPPSSSTTSGSLAFTGSPELPLAIAGLALIGAGLGLEARRRRRTSSEIRTE